VRALVDTGSTEAARAINLAPFSYAAMPGVLRAPFLLLFDDFDQQLRGMQLLNVVIVGASALMGAYILSWALPQRAHAAAIGYAFSFVLLSPDWLANTFVPLADAPYAMLTLACLIIAIRVLTSSRPVREQKAALALFAVLFVTAFMVRFTAPILFVPIALLARGKWMNMRLSRRQKRLVYGVPIGALLLLTVLNGDAIFGKYITEPFWYLFMASKLGVALNLFASALPAQIVPVFNLGYEVTPPTHPLHPAFGTTPRDLAWVFAGLAISAVTIYGVLRSARRFLPELTYLLVILPVLALMVPSTTRYLMSYQPVIWIAFATGLAHLTAPARRKVSLGGLRLIGAASAILVVAGVVALRSAQTARTASRAEAASAFSRPIEYRNEVAKTYRGLRGFIETLPPDRSLIVTSYGESGRWSVIAGRKHYLPRDSTFAGAVRDYEVYSVLACGTPASCQYFETWYASRARRLSQFGSFEYTRVFESRTGSARAAVYRVSQAPPGGAGPAQSASGLTAR
jgi:hypothetical protein